MGLSFPKYLEWLEKQNLNWPTAPPAKKVKAKPLSRPLAGVRAICWETYGTLLKISEGELVHVSSHPLPLQIALDKTIQQFNMWNSMVRKPGEPWEVLLPQYQKLLENLQMVGSQKGTTPEVDSSAVWKTIIERLLERDFQYDVPLMGDIEELCEKVSFFFHASLQGTEAAPQTDELLTSFQEAGLLQGVVDNGQKFSFPHALRLIATQGRLRTQKETLSRSLSVFSHEVGVKAPAVLLFQQAANAFSRAGIPAEQVVYVGSKLEERLSPAKKVGFKTVLYAGDANSLKATQKGLRDENTKPDRLITDLIQLKRIVGLE